MPFAQLYKHKFPALKKRPKAVHQLSLSDYFPAGTQYFYGYPAGETASFINYVPPEVEELVAARVLSCLGGAVTGICFAATTDQTLPQILIDALKLPKPSKRQLITLPSTLAANLTGRSRNIALQEALLSATTQHDLVMAQPFDDAVLRDHYQLSPQLTLWLNSKDNLTHFISDTLVPQRLAMHKNGQEFIAQSQAIPIPCVIKAASSSAGDGVYICRTRADVQNAVSKLSSATTSIVVEQFIDAKKNFGVHFGVPHDPTKPIDIIGVNEQLTSKDGEFFGGIIRSRKIPSEITTIVRYLQETALPKVRRMGWYGVGCVDVLLDSSGKAYFIDCNFRMTGMSAYHFLAINKEVKLPLISFNGTMQGNQSELEKSVLKPIRKGWLKLIALNHHDTEWGFNGAVSFTNQQELRLRVEQLLSAGIRSSALEAMQQELATTKPE